MISNVPSYPPLSDEPSQVILAVAVNIYNAQIISQNNNNFEITFDLHNREQVQPDVKYFVELIKQSDNRAIVVDYEIYSEIINLNDNQTIAKKINYSAPEYLTGKFQIRVVASNNDGLRLASSDLGEVDLVGNNQYVEIDVASCYLEVGGEEDKKYKLNQGVDINAEEVLIAKCDLVNHFDRKIAFTAYFKTYERTISGEEVNVDTGNNRPVIFLDTQERRQINLELPKSHAPQAYDIVLSFANNDGQIISNKVVFHYVLRGLSATIQNLKLDKDYYKKDETINLSLLWSASADNFPNSRFENTDNGKMLVNIEVRDSKGEICASEIAKELKQDMPITEYNILAAIDCYNPKISISIADDKNNILDKKEFFTTGYGASEQNNHSKIDSILLKSALIILVILLLVIFLLFYYKFRKKKIIHSYFNVILYLVFSVVAIFGLTQKVSADSFLFSRTMCLYTDNLTLSVNLDKSVYNSGETARVTGSVSGLSCANTSAGLGVYVRINGSSQLLIDPAEEFVGSANMTVENIGGDYYATISAAWLEGCYPNLFPKYAYFYIPYTVIGPSNDPPSVPVISGPANGVVNTDYTFNFSSTDPENEKLFYQVYWSNEAGDAWLPVQIVPTWGTVASGVSQAIVRKWISAGSKTLAIVAGDSSGNFSDFAYHYITISDTLNNPPVAPTVAGPTTGVLATDYNFTATSTDADDDTLRYGFDWDNNSVVDQWMPAIGLVDSGTAQIATRQWPTTGAKTFKVNACDSKGSCSGFTSHTITISLPITYSCTGTVPTNATLIPGDNLSLVADAPITVVDADTIDKCEYTCDSGYIKSGNSCVACSHATFVCSSFNTGNICDGSTNCGNTITTIDKTCLDVDTCGDSTIVAQSLCSNCTDETETCTCSSGGGPGWIEVAP